jgi:plasmid stabilization system protein ParE
VSIVRLSREAIDELIEAAAWYSARRPGLEMEFLAEVERELPLIESSPASFPRLLDLPRDLVVRRALLPRFPYALVFVDLGTEIRVLAVAHAKRRPGYWLDRVGEEPQ